MIGIVVVSHSARLAEGVVELAREMGGPDVPLQAAGGMSEPGVLGTDAELVRDAIERARSDGGVLVLMDLGSALMSAEMAAEMLPDERVLLCEAPLVEGAVAAAASARGGATLEEAAAEARGALRMKAAQLGAEEAPAEPPATGPELVLAVENPLGLHARPAARFVATAAGFDARITVTNETTGAGPASARSLSAVAALAARQGHEIGLRAEGPEAEAALAALGELARSGFGDAPESATAGRAASPGTGPAAPADADRTAPPQPAAPGEAPPRAGPQATAPPPATGSILRGIPAAPGIVLGPARPARLLGAAALAIPDRPASDPEEEWRLLDAARADARRDIADARAAVAQRAGEEPAAIFDAHRLLLDDEALLEPARRAIFDDGRSAAAAWQAAAQRVAEDWEAVDRAADVLDVANRVLAHLAGESAPTVDAPGILVADELTPAQAAGLDHAVVQGIATARGGPTSHAAILARALGIPAVVGLGDPILALAEATPLLLDGAAGTVHIDPEPAAIREHETRRAAAEEHRAIAREHAHEPATTRDGTRIEVMANLGDPAEAAAAVELGADGVGLLRTEFLFLDRPTLPDEDEQAAVYADIAKALQGRPLIVRTLDVGADKPLPALPQPPEANPFLGRRGIRLSLAEPTQLEVQLRAILRAAAQHPIKVMFPMVTTPAEYRAAKAILDELDGPPIEVGMMVEVPAAALAAEHFAREVDFFSIGTNDLAQYAMAAERGNEHVARLADGPAPPLLRLIEAVTTAAADAGRWVGVCGELAGDPAAAALLAGLGVTELSVAPALVPEIKQAVRGLDLDRARAAAEAALTREDAAAARELGERLITDR